MPDTDLCAGRDLDALVAEKVMGWLVVVDDRNYRGCGVMKPGRTEVCDLPHYSTDIAAAWRVVEAMATRGYGLLLEDWRSNREVVERYRLWFALFTLPDGHDTGAITEATAPLAICRAALKAAGGADG